MATAAPRRRRKHWGWGYEDEQPPYDEVRAAAAAMAPVLGFGDAEPEQPVPLEEVELSAPRIEPPAALAEVCATDTYERAAHAYGKSYRDVVRAFRGRFDHPPDVVAHPTEERELEAVLEWCEGANAAVIPFGGGTSVVGGVEARVGDRYDGAVAIDLKAMDRVLEVDPVSRAARIQAGATGPRLEEQLAEARAHAAPLPPVLPVLDAGRLDRHARRRPLRDALHAHRRPRRVRARDHPGRRVGVAATAGLRRRPVARPAADRLGGHARRDHRGVGPGAGHSRRSGRRPACAFRRSRWARRRCAAIAQAGLYPANCRLIDPAEARLTTGGDGEHALLVLGFESADHELDAWMDRALALCREHGGEWDEPSGGGRGGAAGAWREAFLRAPYLRDTFVAMGVLSETFETAITWERFPAFHEQAIGAAREAVREVCGGGSVSCRFTHVYPDGPAPYFTILAPARPRRGARAAGTAVKAAASDAVIAAGGTITHHHAVGRDHRPWYDRQRPDQFAAALRGGEGGRRPAGSAQPRRADRPRPRVTLMSDVRVHPARVALRVSDVGRSADFYRRIGGLRAREEDAERAVLAAPDDGPVLLELRRAERSGPAPRRATGLFHTAFRYPTRAQLAATLRGLVRERAPLTGASDHLVSEALYLDDPDGLGIELYRDRQRDEWPAPAPGAKVAMDTIPLDLDGVLAEPEPDEDPATGMDVGHVHLKVATVDDAVRWWTDALGMDLMVQLGPQAAFLSTEGYHHDVGANTWMSAGADPEPREGPGLDEIVLTVTGDPRLAAARERLARAGASVEEGEDGSIVTATPDAVPVRLEEPVAHSAA